MMDKKIILSIILVLQILMKANSQRVLDITKYGAWPNADISQVTN